MAKVSQIQEWTSVKRFVGNKDVEFSEITFDSRMASSNALFVAVRGVHVDGHLFISKAIEAGCSIVVCEELPNGEYENTTFVLVEDSALALGEIAAGFYGNPSEKMVLVGVTGTNGKTTVATLLHGLFRDMGFESGLFSTVANFIGSEKLPSTHTTPDPVALNKIMQRMVDAGCKYCFMEVSSHAIDQKRIAGLSFKGGIFTNLTHDHLDYHKTFDAYLKAKKAFFDGLPKDAFAIVNVDDKNGMVMVQNCKAHVKTYSIRSMADYKAKIVESMFEGMQLVINNEELWTPFVGKFNAQNLLAVYGAAASLGCDIREVLLSLSRLHSVDGRFQTMRSASGITAVVDYAHTPDALKNVIETINQIRQPEQALLTVVGAGGDRDKTKRPEMAGVAVSGSDRVILTSDNPRSEDPQSIVDDMMEGVDLQSKIKVLTVVDRKEAIKAACMLAKRGDIVLVAGKGHEDYQEIQGVKHHFDDREVIKEIFDMI
ncbi:UDP-N-acetylmuramoyl-L-alanyl-D-glutamate--2,6-diaminopimelate ligase [Saccharicrinis fermentans]|uniref:UDP-N-acetylmuramoyl-L-alanyl-D-glutamate--2,6-diaminopimelate ligase n=1 Tax=Saccharicrinis fermentans DSM 9555 = JCM 21142 TaxID=869213 RepID=W7YDV7_9BACT|nr:UDP-N-acetylmuramoyl-L-alanyl-D-glutamate--2,6-diaminopimelate ligase [Saccharicrinis fermentans]GAF02651.1 UDP-N-acetylmuramoyl-L-alanyl-D-glutamate-L-lysine ligase [Saccharicrinis fermentans DSM 9555 = JCM 21142]